MKVSIFKNRLLQIIFFLAVFLRFIYFPDDIGFGYDQARDAFISLKVLRGDFVIVGPPSTFNGIHHGALFYYLFAPFYFLANGSPILLSVLLRILNAAGVFLVYLIAKNLFSKKAGYISAFIFALSFEQTQFAIFLAHPALAVFTSLLFFWGMTELIFNKKNWGLIIASIGLGLSSQMHFSMIVLYPTAVALFLIFRKNIVNLDKKTVLASALVLLMLLSTFILTEIKFDFQNIRGVINLVSSQTGGESSLHLVSPLYVVSNYFDRNIFYINNAYINLVFLAVFIISFKKFKTERRQFLFLFVWLILGVLTYLPDNPSHLRHTNAIGTSFTLIIFTSFLLSKLSSRLMLLGLFVILVSNINLIRTHNYNGYSTEAEDGADMFLPTQKQVLDYMYSSANKENFSVNSISVPYNINTTWSYLFEWYGKEKYGYVPVWAGNAAEGFEGNLKVVTARSEGPQLHFLIIESGRGLTSDLINRYINEENIFTRVIEEKQFRQLVVQKRIRY